MAFHSNLMHKEDFFVDKHTTVPVDMIWKTGQMIYSRSEELFATMVKIPFVGNMSIVLVLPDVGQPDSAVKEIVVQRATLLQSSNMRYVTLEGHSRSTLKFCSDLTSSEQKSYFRGIEYLLFPSIFVENEISQVGRMVAWLPLSARCP